MIDKRVHNAVSALHRGDKHTARRLLNQCVHDDPDDLSAWWYLVAALTDPEQQKHSLRQVLRLDPDHSEAANLLAQLNRRGIQAISTDGFKRLDILDATPSAEGLVILPPGSIEATILQRPIEIDSPTPLLPSPKSRLNPITLWVFGGIALAAVTGFVLLIGLQFLTNFTSSDEDTPATRQLAFDPPSCTTTPNEMTTLTFINSTGLTIDLMQGPASKEEILFTLSPDSRKSIEATVGVAIRYAVRTNDDSIEGGGVIIEVPAGQLCEIPIH